MALALAGSSLGAGPAGRRRSRRARPSDFKVAHTVWADTGLPCAVKAVAISVTDWSSARRTSTRSRTVLVLRAEDQSVTEIANALTAQGSPVSAQTVWAILKSEGLERLERRRPAGPAPRLEPAKAKAIGHWPTGARYDCDHAGLYLLLPAMAELGLDTLVGAAHYPGTTVLSAFHSLGSLLMLKCSRRGRVANAFPLGADPGLGLALGLAALPKATHLTSYSYRVRRASNVALLE